MKKQSIILISLIPLLLCGCLGTGAITRNLAKDGAIVIADINSPYGKQKFVRIGTTTNRVEVTEQGHVIINGK